MILFFDDFDFTLFPSVIFRRNPCAKESSLKAQKTVVTLSASE